MIHLVDALIQQMVDQPKIDLGTMNVNPYVNKGGRPAKSKTISFDEFSISDLNVFVELVEQYPLIWDTTDKNFHRGDIKGIAFDEIEKECSRFLRRGRTHGKNAKILWEDLIARRKMEKERIINTGNLSDTSFPMYNAMAFLDGDFIKKEITDSRLFGLEDIIAQNLAQSAETSRMSIDSPPIKKSKGSDINEVFTLLQQTNNQVTELYHKITRDRNDGASSSKYSDLFSLISQHLDKQSPSRRAINLSKITQFVVSLEEEAGNQPDTKNTIKIAVKLIFGTTVNLEVELSDTVESVKNKLQGKDGVIPSKRKLIFDGVSLSNERTLSDYNIENGSTIFSCLIPH